MRNHGASENTVLDPLIAGGSNIRLAGKGPEPRTALSQSSCKKKAAFQPPFLLLDALGLLADMHAAVLAAEPGAGDADEAVGAGIGSPADWRGRDCSRGADGAADHTGCDFARPEAAVAIVPAVVAVVP